MKKIVFAVQVIAFEVKEYLFLKDMYVKNPQHLKTYLEYLDMCKNNEWTNFVEDYIYAITEIMVSKAKGYKVKLDL